MNKVEKIAADGSRLFEGTIKMQDFRDNHFLGRTTNKWLFEATLKPHYKTFFSLTIILCNVIFASSSSSYGAGRHLCQENESPQLDGWVVVGEMRSRYWNSCSPQDVRTASMLFPREIWGGEWRRIIVCRSDFGHSCENHKMEQASKGLKKHVKKYHSGEQDHCLGHSCWNYSKGNLRQFFSLKVQISGKRYWHQLSQTLNKMFPRDSQCQWTAIVVI